MVVSLTFPIFFIDLKKIVRIKDDEELDPYLKRLSLSTLAFTLLFCAGIMISAQ